MSWALFGPEDLLGHGVFGAFTIFSHRKLNSKHKAQPTLGVKTLESVSLDAVLFVEILGLSIAYDGYGIPTHFKMLSLMVYEFTRRTGHMEPFHIKNTTQKNTAHLRCENFYKKKCSFSFGPFCRGTWLSSGSGIF